jgi:hypothetical protein
MNGMLKAGLIAGMSKAELIENITQLERENEECVREYASSGSSLYRAGDNYTTSGSPINNVIAQGYMIETSTQGIECPWCGTLYRDFISRCTQCGGSVGYGKRHEESLPRESAKECDWTFFPTSDTLVVGRDKWGQCCDELKPLIRWA